MLDIITIIKHAILAVVATDDRGEATRDIHYNRSHSFVENIASALRSHYDGNTSVRVFSRGCDINRAEFGINELLYDITVCSTAKIPSTRHGIDHTYITGSLWQIESEVEKGDYREGLLDFNKLVLGESENKLFIGSIRKDDRRMLEVLSKPAQHCKRNVYTALITHPSDWHNSPIIVKLWKYNAGSLQWDEA